MPQNKYISTKDAVRLTGLSTEEIYDLIHSGKLPAHKAPKSGWRILPKDLVALGLIQEDTDTTEKAWDDPDILKHTWKRFTKMTKEHDKDLRERYGKE